MATKKRKAATLAVDDAATATSSALDISKMSAKERKALISKLSKQDKAHDASTKKKKKEKIKNAEKTAEADYQASSQPPSSQPPPAKKKKVAAVEPAATSSPTPAPRPRTSAKISTASAAQNDSGAESGGGDSLPSPTAYDSGGEAVSFGIDPVLIAADKAKAAAARKAAPTQEVIMQIASQPKQVRPKGAAMIAVGPVQTVHTSIKPRRDKIKKPPPPRKMSSSSESDGSSSDSSTDSDSDEKEQTRVTAGPHTPYKRPDIARGKSGPALTALSPTSRALGEDSRTAYTVLLATENAFPEENEGKKKARKAFIEEFDELAADVDEDGPDEETARSLRRRDRAIASTEYKHDMVHVTMSVESPFRGHVVTDAIPLVEREYELDELTEDAVRERVQHLLQRGNFTFADYDTRKGKFGCPVLPKLLRKAFLTKAVKRGHALGLGPNYPKFSEVPPALLAFLLTAVECVLRRWATGTYDQKVYFTAASYEPHYKRHLAALHQFQARDPLAFHTVRAEIWRMACKNTAVPSEPIVIDDVEGYMCDEDFAQDEAAAA